MIVPARNHEKAVGNLSDVAGDVTIMEMDLADLSSVRKFAADFAAQHDRLDLLINNAGIMFEDDIDRIDIDAVRLQFEVNTLGPLNVVLALRNRLRAGSRIINISSRLGSIGDNGSGNDYGYRISKAAQNMLTSNLALELGNEGVYVAAIHPGIVATL